MTTAEALAKLRGCLDGEIHWEGVGPKPWWEPLALIEKEMERLRMMQAHALRADEWQDRAEKAEADCEEYLRRILSWQDRAEKAEAERDAAYTNGESSGYADWVGTLGDFCEELTPDEGWLPTTMVAVIQRLRAERDELGNALAQERAKPGGAYDLAAAEQRVAELEAALRLIANPDGVVRAGDPSAMRIPPYDIARRALGDGEE